MELLQWQKKYLPVNYIKIVKSCFFIDKRYNAYIYT